MRSSTHPDTPPRIVLFIADGAGTSYWTAAATRAPTLPEMTAAALSILGRDPDGFSLIGLGAC